MTKLTIFQFSFGDGYAGSAKIAIQSSRLLTEKGHNVTLFVSNDSLTEKRGLEAGLDIARVNSSQPYKILKDQVFSEFKNKKPLVVIGHHSLDRKIGISLKRKFGRRVVNIPYRHNITKTFPIIGSFIYNMYSDYMIACSKGVSSSLVSSGIIERKIEVIYNGIQVPEDLNHINGDSIRKKYSLEGKKVLGLSTWFHKERKGFDILFKAFAALDDNFVLLLLGITGSDMEAVIKYAAEFGIQKEKIILPGYVENIWEYYKAMDIFLLPSRSEGFSLALLEAAAAGIPAVASNIPGNDEFIKNGVNGILFNPSKPDELTKNIRMLAEDSRLAGAFSACARRHVMSSYTIKHYADHLEKFLIKAAGH